MRSAAGAVRGRGGLALLLLAACAPGLPGARRAGSSDAILGDEIRAVRAVTAYDAVVRLRPEWLRDRQGGPFVVYLDNVRYGGPETLASIRAGPIVEIRWLGGSEALARLGSGHAGGVIFISTSTR